MNSKRVSIPHRYGKNTNFVKIIEGRYEFPFLIGTVRTNGPGIYRQVHLEFPFLIGTVRTKQS